MVLEKRNLNKELECARLIIVYRTGKRQTPMHNWTGIDDDIPKVSAGRGDLSPKSILCAHQVRA